jgi:hypothetical protein
MESNVWIQLFAQVVSFLSNLLNSSTAAKKQESPISSSNAPANAVSSSSTSNPYLTDGKAVLKVIRNPKLTTKDGVFGDMVFNGGNVCVSVENEALMIPEGLYDATKDMSPRLGYICPHLRVPSRDEKAGGDAGIRIHILNDPNQSEGCIGAGSRVDGDAVDDSRDAFTKLMNVLPDTFQVLICSSH